MQFVADIYANLGRHDNHMNIVAALLAFALAVFIIKIAAYTHNKAMLTTFRTDAKKEIKQQEEIKNYKSKILKKAASEYINTARRAVTNISSAAIAHRIIAGTALWGWKYANILPITEHADFTFAGIAAVLAVIYPGNAAVYGLLGIILFAAFRIQNAFFNIRAVREIFTDELAICLDRELARYFATDLGASVLRLKNDLTMAINNQTTKIAASTEQITAEFQNFGNAIAEMQALNTALTAQTKTLTEHTKYTTQNQTALEATLHAYEAALQNISQSMGDALAAFVAVHAQESAKTINDTMKINIERMSNIINKGQNP